MQGASLETVDNLPASDAKNIWVMMSTGVEGPYKDYIIAFVTTPQDKKNRKEFKQMFPTAHAFMTLKKGGDKERNKAMGAAAALMSEGAPAWLQQAMKEK